MGVLTVRMLQGIVRYEVGSKPGTPVEFRELVNLAGEHFVAMHPWRWLEGRSITLRQRASITLTGATWTEGSKTLTSVGAFADYTWLRGDTFLDASGTDVTEGGYEVASRVSDDAITLTTSLGAAATTVAGRLPNDQIALAPNFDLQAITAIQTVDGTVSSFQWTGAQSMLDVRSWPGLTSSVSFRGLLRWVRGTTGGQPVPRLEVWPENTEDAEFLTLFYRGGWLVPDTDTTELSLPNWCNLLFIEVVKALVSGFEDPEQGTVDQRLTALKMGGLFRDAVMRDTMIQDDLGAMECGWTESPRASVGRYDTPFSTVLPA